jgi:dolichol-phosphate mannosyltransferase
VKVLRLVALAQAGAAIVVGRRLARGAHRERPLRPLAAPAGTTISVVIPARNEEGRLGPLLAALASAGGEVLEVLVVDDESQDGTAAVVRTASARDPRVRLVRGAPLPPGWVGKSWALQQGLELAQGDWLLALDADVRVDPALPGALVAVARARGLDLLTAGPRFIVDTVGERLLHPALLATLVYRFGPPGTFPRGRELANGQCLLAPRARLLAAGGWRPVAPQMTEDVALVRHLAAEGWRTGMCDASPLLAVDMHDSAREAWREWGRSLSLPGVAPGRQQALDIVCLALTMALPLPVLVAAARHRDPFPFAVAAALLGVRLGIHAAVAGVYDRRGPAWWLAPAADPLAVARLSAGALRPNRRWRGRAYAEG